ncbi:hypothetical protein [Capnocytophaga sp.]|uniref:hypothetical protein n=1 Tax=Capnocytophaga sp. TaxID=44737 RepID=UPI0026DB87ED|nr:hypothetical protein [Capnocytophaga sp.]MDO5104813.1 hypothetical protein [Capnocytophaga sp.]
MTNISNLVESLEEKVLSLSERISDLKTQNQHLIETIKTLEKQKKDLEEAVLKWKEKNDAIKVANSILGSNETKTEAKLKINALIREIDACIVQLSK